MDNYFIAGVSSLDGTMVSNVMEREELYLIFEFPVVLKLHVYPFDDGIVGYIFSSLDLAKTE